jgi:hypothetical protein
MSVSPLIVAGVNAQLSCCDSGDCGLTSCSLYRLALFPDSRQHSSDRDRKSNTASATAMGGITLLMAKSRRT